MGCHIPNRAARSLFIIFPSPGFNHKLRFLQAQKPVLVQTIIPKLPIEPLRAELPLVADGSPRPVAVFEESGERMTGYATNQF